MAECCFMLSSILTLFGSYNIVSDKQVKQRLLSRNKFILNTSDVKCLHEPLGSLWGSSTNTASCEHSSNMTKINRVHDFLKFAGETSTCQRENNIFLFKKICVHSEY